MCSEARRGTLMVIIINLYILTFKVPWRASEVLFEFFYFLFYFLKNEMIMKKFKYKTKKGHVVEILYDKYFKTFECYDYIYHINVDNQFVNELFKYTKKIRKIFRKKFLIFELL